MKKILSLLLAAALLFALAACGGTPAQTQTPNTDEPEVVEPAAPDGEDADTNDEDASGDETPEAPEGAILSVDDLEGKTIGVQLGTTGDIYAEDIPNATIERYSKGAEAIMSLVQGKIDAVIIDDQPAKVFVEKNSGEIMVLDEPFTVEDYAICVAKENSELRDQMNAAIAELKEDGTLQALLDYYIGGVEDAKPYEAPADVDRSKGTLTMATNAHFPPYEYYENNEIVGLDADFARAICDKLGYDLFIEDMEFNSIIVAVQTGKADFGAAGMTVTEERLVNIDFTDSYCTASQVVIIKK